MLKAISYSIADVSKKKFNFRFFVFFNFDFSVREQCKVIYSYKPANEDELDLKEGEIITILSKELPDKGWWKGELKGKIGVFPDNFVQIIPSEGMKLNSNTEKTKNLLQFNNIYFNFAKIHRITIKRTIE